MIVLKFLKALIIVCCILLVTSCGKINNVDKTLSEETIESENVNNIQVKGFMEKTDEINENSKETVTNSRNNGIENKGIITIEAVYIGQVDPHTIEVETDQETVIIQTSDASIDINEVKDGSRVVISYKITNGQNVLNHIESAE